jgi:hypothetical protein
VARFQIDLVLYAIDTPASAPADLVGLRQTCEQQGVEWREYAFVVPGASIGGTDSLRAGTAPAYAADPRPPRSSRDRIN